MTGIFRANNPFNNFLLFLYALLLKFPIFIHPHIPQEQPFDGFMYKGLLHLMQSVAWGSTFLYSLVAFLLLFIQAISLNSLVNDLRLMQKPNYLTGMSYLLITSLFSDWYYLSSPLIVNTILIAVLSMLCKLHNNNNPKASLFNIGIITGLATFFYFPSIIFVLLIIAGLGLTRPFRLREWLMPLLGILTPYYFLGAWVFLTGRWRKPDLPELSLSWPEFVQTKWALASVIIIFLLIMVGIFFIQNNIRRQLLQVRKSWSMIFLYLVVSILVPFINTAKSFEYWILVAVPVAAISGAAFLYPEKKWFAIVMHWSMVLIALMMGYFLI